MLKYLLTIEENKFPLAEVVGLVRRGTYYFKLLSNNYANLLGESQDIVNGKRNWPYEGV